MIEGCCSLIRALNWHDSSIIRDFIIDIGGQGRPKEDFLAEIKFANRCVCCSSYYYFDGNHYCNKQNIIKEAEERLKIY